MLNIFLFFLLAEDIENLPTGQELNPSAGQELISPEKQESPETDLVSVTSPSPRSNSENSANTATSLTEKYETPKKLPPFKSTKKKHRLSHKKTKRSKNKHHASHQRKKHAKKKASHRKPTTHSIESSK